MFPYRGMIACWLLECLLLIAVIVLPERFVSLEIPPPPTRPQWDVIYYSGDELPQTQDRGGAQAGKSGRAGGQQAHHRTQTIRVARGDSPSEKVVDAPNINLPHSDSAVANLLAFKPNPGPPPAEGLRSSLTAPNLPAMSVVPPSPELNSSASRTPNILTTNIIPPAPECSYAADKMRTANPLAPAVIAPAPRDAQRDLASSRVPLTQTVDVVAPPVSAPQRDVSSTPKLTLPAPAVVAPPPSQVSRDLNSWGSSATGDLRAKSCASAAHRIRRRVIREIWRCRAYASSCAASRQHRRQRFSEKRFPGNGGRSGQSAGALLGSATSYHLHRVWAAAKPFLVADEATRERAPAVRSI